MPPPPRLSTACCTVLVVACLVVTGCSKPSSSAPPAASAQSATSDSVAAPEAQPAAPIAPPQAAAPEAPAPPAAPETSAAPSTRPPPRAHVRVEHIGMHIGGGPNDDVTKEPIRKSVTPHFEALADCFVSSGAKAGGDVGVDLLIPAVGGKAKVSHPRTTLKGVTPALEQCVVSVFEAIDFLKPRTGRSVVSYSLRFTP